MEPGSSALSEKAWPDRRIRQLTHLLRVVRAPKKGGDLFQREEIEGHKAGMDAGPEIHSFELLLDLDNHFLVCLPFRSFTSRATTPPVIFRILTFAILFLDYSNIPAPCRMKSMKFDERSIKNSGSMALVPPVHPTEIPHFYIPLHQGTYAATDGIA